MKPNKVTDSIYKKLLKQDFVREDINLLIDLQHQFTNFDNYIYYLFILANKSFDDVKVRMCKALESYLQYLVSTENLQPLSIDNLQRSNILSDQEIFLLGVKQFNISSGFSYDLDENVFICLDHTHYVQYADIMNVALPQKNGDFLKSKITQKFCQHKFKKICLFKKINEKNIFLGFYKFIDTARIYKQTLPIHSIILMNQINTNLSLLDEYQNILDRSQKESLQSLKQICKELIIKDKTDAYYLLEVIRLAGDHYCLVKQLTQHCLATDNQKLLKQLLHEFPELVWTDFSMLELAPNNSYLNPFNLVVLANTYDILYGTQINADYRNNIFICLPQNKLETTDNGQIQMRFIKSFNNHFLDLEINKKIFDTANSATVINLFIKLDDQKYLFKGFYKVSKITIDKDLQDNFTPIFNMRPTNGIENLDFLTYSMQQETSNAYKNNFIHFQDKVAGYGKWLTKAQPIVPVITNRHNEHVNSLLYKANWIQAKCLIALDSEQYPKYLTAYQYFDRGVLTNILKCLAYDFEYLLTNTIMQPWTIAYEMTKKNWSSKGLFEIAYMDFYETKENKYAKCLKILKE